MPSDPSINLTTSAAAAFCARLCVHPLDHLKASLQHVEPLPKDHGIRLRLNHLLTTIQHHLHTLHITTHTTTTQEHTRRQHHTTFREQIKLWRGLYHGVPFALIINVPALAFFLSTYDATKHGIAFISSHMSLSHFQLHHFETHLISGMMAKVAGTILWAPMTKLGEMQKNSRHGQLSLQEALLLVKKVVAAEEWGRGGRRGGVWSLWSGYRTTLTSLLPYTMLYFATYEKLKQLVRKVVISQEEQQYGSATGSKAGRGVIDYRTDQRPLGLGTYMICVAGAVAISSTVCHTAEALRVHIRERWIPPVSPTPPSPVLRTTVSVMTTKMLAPPLVTSQQHHPHTWTPPSHPSVTQHANITTKTELVHSLRRPLTGPGSATHPQMQKQQYGGLLRRIGRGLGPRVMWTAPGVTLTTAGFEVFRNLALGSV